MSAYGFLDDHRLARDGLGQNSHHRRDRHRPMAARFFETLPLGEFLFLLERSQPPAALFGRLANGG
jgi:hypothetical protein